MKSHILLLLFILLSLYNYSQFWNDPCWSHDKYYLQPLKCPENYPYTLVFDEEFAGNSLDLSKWEIQPWAQGALNNAQNMEYDTLANVTVANGICSITAKKETVVRKAVDWEPDNAILADGYPNYPRTYQYTSANVWSKKQFKFKYGKFEICCKIPEIPNGKAFWPAFWLYGDPGKQEIDVFDGFRPGGECTNYVSNCMPMGYHIVPNGMTNGSCASEEDFIDYPRQELGDDYSKAFHKFSVEWDEYGIVWVVDGNVVRTVTTYYNVSGQAVSCSNIINIPGIYFQKYLPNIPLNIIFNLAISRSVPPDETTPFPSSFEIRYIKVWKRDEGCCMPYKLYEATANLPPATNVSNYITAGNNAGIPNASTGNVTVMSGQNVEFSAGNSITLLPGFIVEPGANFTAQIEDCTSLNQPVGDPITIVNIPDGFSDQLCVSVNGATYYNIRVEFDDGNGIFSQDNVPIYTDPVCVWDGSCHYGWPNCFLYTRCNRRRTVIFDFYNCDQKVSQTKKVWVNCSGSDKIIKDTTNINFKNDSIFSFKISPNPFNTNLNIDYNITKTENIRISIYNTISIKIADIVNEVQQDGSHHVVFDGSKLEAGIYFCNLETDNYRQTKKIVLIK